MHEQNKDGSVGPNRTPSFVRKAIGEGSRKRDYSKIRIPILAFIPVTPSQTSGWSVFYRFQPVTDEERAALEKIYATDRNCMNRSVSTMRAAVPHARIIELPGADHYVFFSNEADVLRELKAFLAGLD